ncbi:hypothetical protein [Mycolicibacterium hippocampi]|uniref:Uncharacterized protein n=1 Tax=Mycolicibacterium hippocampi TaxID=659824 RepID=A0A850PMP5_9MYCO|nr:hypothetical protein [Mycolicibacterium hippocampi]NVN51622.1 hypothetical protein [Mycolicibacterium hippocampi]
MRPEHVHLKTIEEAIAELHPLTVITSSPASVQYQYVGTIVENTLVLLTAAANSLDQGSRNITFSDFDNWISAMQAIHRSFYSSIHSAVEISLTDFCKDNNIDVSSTRSRKAESLISELCDSLTEKQKRDIRSLGGDNPAFMDYLGAVTKARIEDPTQRKIWNKFFDALSVLRNKASHSHPSLSDSDKKKLIDGGCGALVSEDGNLQLNSRNYKQVIDIVLQFFQVIGAHEAS